MDLEVVAGIDTADGVDHEDASAIAFVYWVSHQPSLCGGPRSPERHGDWWTTCVTGGYAGDHEGGCMRIHARSGAISSTFARPYRNVEHFHAYLAAYVLEL